MVGQQTVIPKKKKKKQNKYEGATKYL